MKAEAGTGKRILHRKKVPPLSPTKKEGDAMPMPGESSGRLHCTKEGQWGNTYSRRGDPTITTCNGLGRRIRTRLVRFFLFFFLWSRQTPSRGGRGSFFIPGQRSASSPRKRERERESLDSKRCGNKTTGRDILPLCSGE